MGVPPSRAPRERVGLLTLFLILGFKTDGPFDFDFGLSSRLTTNRNLSSVMCPG